MIDTDKNLNWDKFINIINLINKDNKWMKQYIDASNLKARINIHDKVPLELVPGNKTYLQVTKT